MWWQTEGPRGAQSLPQTPSHRLTGLPASPFGPLLIHSKAARGVLLHVSILSLLCSPTFPRTSQFTQSKSQSPDSRGPTRPSGAGPPPHVLLRSLRTLLRTQAASVPPSLHGGRGLPQDLGTGHDACFERRFSTGPAPSPPPHLGSVSPNPDSFI